MSEPDVSTLLSVPEALHILDTFPLTPRPTALPLSHALNHTLAEDLKSDRDYPPFDKSQMDGYALRAADAATPPFTLPTTEEILPGTTPPPLPPGHAAPIMTGAPLPPGADSIIPVEDTVPPFSAGPQGRAAVTFKAPPTKGRFIAPRASDTRAGVVLLPKGTRLGPAALAVAATIGAAQLKVYPRPRVALLVTGDELVDPALTPTLTQIRNSNGAMLEALLKTLGADVTNLGHAPDDPPAISAAMTEGLTNLLPPREDSSFATSADALFVSGGMSMGSHDFVPRLLQDLGFTLAITKLRIKPGKPFVFAHRPMPQPPDPTPSKPFRLISRVPAPPRHQFAFGLPGNPVSAYLCTLRLAARLLARMQGQDPNPKLARAPLAAALLPNGPREFYQPVDLDPTGRAVPLPWKGSADVFTLARAKALLIRPENAPALPAGAQVDLLDLP